jgi:uncharacterized protein HemY
MRSLTRVIYVLMILGLAWLMVVLFHESQALRSEETPDGTKVMLIFLALIILAVVVGTLVATTIVPQIGETIGNFFFNPDQEIEKAPHTDAMAKLAQGDYEGAIEEFKNCLDDNPDDMHAASEIVHIYCDKLVDIDSAEAFLEDALQKEWPPEQGAFLASRMVDIYWNYRHDAMRAKHVLAQIAETMPDTKHAANAVHRMHEIDRALMDEEAGIKLHTKAELTDVGEDEPLPPG